MKCRIAPQKKLSRQQIKACAEYVDELNESNANRLFKLFCICLNKNFKFGADRLSRLIESVQELSELHATDEVFWEHIDRELHRIGVHFKDEQYEDILEDWKNENKKSI